MTNLTPPPGTRIQRADGTWLNLWGTPIEDVGEGFCPDCERDLPWHYRACPWHPRRRAES